MTNENKEKLAKKLRTLVELFTQNKFEEISKNYPSEYNLTSEEIQDSIKSYGGKLSMPPEKEFTNFEIVEVNDISPKLWDVRFSLWTIEEGRSDLTIVLDVEESSEEDYIIRLRDILVP